MRGGLLPGPALSPGCAWLRERGCRPGACSPHSSPHGRAAVSASCPLRARPSPVFGLPPKLFTLMLALEESKSWIPLWGEAPVLLAKGPEEAEGPAKHKAGPQPRQAQPGASAP